MKPRTLFFTGITVLLLIFLGWQNTSYSSGNEPFLLLPQLRAVQVYQRQLVNWMECLQEWDGRLAVLFSSEKRDLFQASREAEKISRKLLRLYREIDQSSPPDSLQGLQDEMLETAVAYLETATLGLHWISSGAEVDLEKARTSLAEAQVILQKLHTIPWMWKR